MQIEIIITITPYPTPPTIAESWQKIDSKKRLSNKN
jgi:hypothetical protein